MSEDEPVEGFVRRKRIRAGHRGSVTRIIGQLQTTLALESADTRKLKQLKQSLIEKSGILAKLDEDLSETVEDEQLEAEIEQADQIREEISLAVINIEESLAAIAAPTEEHSRRRRAEVSPSPPLEEDRLAALRSPMSTVDTLRTTTAPTRTG